VIEPTYLGDGVYAEADQNGCISIYTSNGLTQSQHIWLEPEVLDSLNKYAKRVWEGNDG
jgi:hypothetical protein